MIEVELGGDLVNELDILAVPGGRDLPALAFGVEALVKQGCEVLLGPAVPGEHVPEKVLVDFAR
jgi:hypothetical protein